MRWTSDNVQEPPPTEFFGKTRRTFGDRSMAIALGDLGIELSGLDQGLVEALHERYTPYSTSRAETASVLCVRLADEPRDYFIDPPRGMEFTRVLLAPDPAGVRVRYVSYRLAGWFDCRGGVGEALLARGDFEPVERAIENYVRAAVAWQAATLGGALVHAASSVRDGEGYLFYGESGAGKSTLAAHDSRGRVASDDLSLVLPGPDGALQLVGSPFRGTYTGGDPVRGRYPLAAGFRLVQDDRARVVEVPRVRALSELVGNLPFVAEAFGTRPDLFASIQAALVAIPLAHLHFRKDDSYWDAIDDWERTRS